MDYTSTRDNNVCFTASNAIIKGISKDGGLFVPCRFPNLHDKFDELKNLEYKALAAKIMKEYLVEFDEKTLLEYANNAYSDFDDENIVPLKQLNDNVFMLELWHGPTLAFKDMALQMLPHLLKGSLKINEVDKEILILVATSGDTGKAALCGFADVDKTSICVFYPFDGVSKAQKMQMITQEGKNVSVNGIYGNFDDAQSGVKKLFTSKEFNEKIEKLGYSLSSANSINWGRLLPQVVYYFYAYFQLVNSNKIKMGELADVCVPTGNFGNILAAYYAKQMGLPIDRLICASNINNVLTDFFKTGTYSIDRDFHKTNTPSMDILISSNLERLLYHLSENDDAQIVELMNSLKEKKQYSVNENIKAKMDKEFFVGYCDEKATLDVINIVYEEEKYLMDTHTAIAYDVVSQYRQKTGETKPCIIASTASPYKFSSSVLEALDVELNEDELANARKIEEITGLKVPQKLVDVFGKKIRFTNICEKDEMENVVIDWIK